MGLPAPYSPTITIQEELEMDVVQEAEIHAFVKSLVTCKLSPETTAAQLFALFTAPEHEPDLFYDICAELLRVTQECPNAEGQIALIAALFRLLKEEGTRRGSNAATSPTVMVHLGGPQCTQRFLYWHNIPVPPGYRYNWVTFALDPDPEYVQGDSFQVDLMEYAHKHEGLLCLWSLVGGLDADSLRGAEKLGNSDFPLFFHPGHELLRVLEDPVNRGVWETLWAVVLRCKEEFSYGQ